MLLNRRGEVLVAQRNDIAIAAWQMPQGGIDDGEEPRVAALRELAEEIGTDRAEILAESRHWLRYDLPAEALRPGRRWRGQIQKWFVMRFTGTDADIDVAGTKLELTKPEFCAWKWVPLQELPQLIVAFKRQVYLDLLTEFRPLFEALGCAP